MDIKQINLNDVLNNIKRNEYQIPNFQRAFVWKKENIVSLLDSIWKNYPIGALLALPMSKIHLAHTSLEIKNNFTKNEYNKNNSFYILDGQQRLTSLAIALVAGEMDYKKNNKLAFYFNYENYALHCLKEAEDKFNKNFFDKDKVVEKDLEIFSYVETKDVVSKIINTHFISTNLLWNNMYKNIFNERDFFQRFIKKYGIDESNLSEIEILVTNALSLVLYNYKIVFQFLDENESIEAICRIFETINSTGTKLTVLDLLVAKTYSDKFSLKKIVDELEDVLSETPFSKESLLHLSLFIKKFKLKRTYSLSKEELFKLESEDFNSEIINNIKITFEQYLNFMKNKRLHKMVIYVPLMILIIAADVVLKLKGKKGLFETHHNFLYKLILSRAMKKSYNKTNAPNDYRYLLDLISTETSESEMEISGYNERFFKDYKVESIDKWGILTLGNKAKINYVIYSLLYSNLKNCIDGEQYEDISKLEEHHILPQAVGRKENINKDKVDSIANKILISSSLNKNISDSYPQFYVKKLYEEHGNLEVLKNHKLLLLSDNINENFSDPEKFIDKRAEILAELINNYFKAINLNL